MLMWRRPPAKPLFGKCEATGFVSTEVPSTWIRGFGANLNKAIPPGHLRAVCWWLYSYLAEGVRAAEDQSGGPISKTRLNQYQRRRELQSQSSGSSGSVLSSGRLTRNWPILAGSALLRAERKGKKEKLIQWPIRSLYFLSFFSTI